jgi:hypothetical protein
MLRFLTRFSTRYFLVLIIFIYTVYFVGSLIFRVRPPQELLFSLFDTLIVAVFISPPLLSLFLLRRPSFWRVLLHVATAFYILWIVYIFTFSFPPKLLWKYINLIFLLVYSGGALVAGLPEAMAAGRWARLVYYAALLLWIYFVATLIS